MKPTSLRTFKKMLIREVIMKKLGRWGEIIFYGLIVALGLGFTALWVLLALSMIGRY